MSTNEVWEALKDAPWERLSRIHGNCHSSIIGLITGWWVDQGDDYEALEGPPGFRSRRNADAVLCRDSLPVGVLEVEGSQYAKKARTIGRYLCPVGRHKELEGVGFGILVLYPISVSKKTGETSLLSTPAVKQCLERTKEITRMLDGSQVFVVAVDKRYEPEVGPVRTICQNGYHRCRASRVQVVRFEAGDETTPIEVWPRPPG